MGPALFGAGCALAVEREAGLLKLKRALPAPAGAYLIAKMMMAMVFAALAMIALVVAALAAGKISLTGLAAADHDRRDDRWRDPVRAPSACSSARTPPDRRRRRSRICIFLPMLWLSGLFIPLPKFLERLAVIWPAFHLNQVALGSAGVTEFSFVSPAISAAVLVGVTVIFGGLAIRRLARHG